MTTGGPTIELAAGVLRVLAPNPGPMTLEGTNTWVLAPNATAGSGSTDHVGAVVIDPGPDDTRHLEAVLIAARGRVSLILTTHRHADHTAGVAALARETGARALTAEQLAPAGPALTPVTPAPGPFGQLQVVATPGHTADSVCFWRTDPGSEAVLFTGDTVLGRGSSVIDADGDLTGLLDSLTRLQALAAAHPAAVLAPGHGPVGAPATGVIDAALAHRAQRLKQVARAVSAGASTPSDVVDTVYPGLDPALRAAAERTAAATLVHGRAHLGWPPASGEAD